MVKIRPAVKADRQELLRILSDTPEFKQTEVTVALEVIDYCFKDGSASGYYLLVADDDRKVVGYICFGPTPLTEDTWDMYWEAVDQDKRGQGIGSALIEAAESKIKRAGGRLALIETSSTPAYEKTRSFHKKNGYEIIACVPDFYSPGDDKLILQKRFEPR